MVPERLGIAQAAPLEVGLTVRDLEASLAFYRDALGFAEVSRIVNPAESGRESGISMGGYTVVRLQLPRGERLKLFAPDQGAADLPRGETPLSRVGLAFVTLIVEDLPGLLERLGQRSIRARRRRPVELRPGVLVALVDDPDLNVVELVEYVDVGSYRTDISSYRSQPT